MPFLNRFWNFKFIDRKQKVQPQQEATPIIKKETIYIMPKEVKNTEYVTIEQYETFKVHDLANMFPYNITPALIESKIQHAIALKQSMLNRLTPQFVLMFIMILIGASVAFVIIWKFMGAGSQEVVIKLAPGLQSAGIQAQVLTNLTG